MNRVLSDGKMNHWHTGSLDGTATMLIRRHDGKNMVMLLNTRSSPKTTKLADDVDKLLHEAVNAFGVWK